MPKTEKPDWKIQAERERKSLPGWYSLTEAKKLLGYTQISTLSRMIAEGKLLSVKCGTMQFLEDWKVAELKEQGKGNSES